MTNYAVEDIALGFAPVPPEMLTHRPKVTEAEMKTWCVFALYRTYATGETHVGAQTVARILGVDRTTVGRAVEGLKKKGFLLDLGRERDPDTKRWGPRRFAPAVNGQRLLYGRISGAAAEGKSGEESGAEATTQTHDAAVPPGSANRASTHKTEDEATMQATMQTHDASHDASAHHSIYTEGDQRVTKVNEGPSGGASPSPQDGNDARTHKSTDATGGGRPANYMTSLTVERSVEVGFDPAPHQRQNWGRGWSEYVYVKEGEDPPPVEEQHAVLGEIVAAAAGRLGKGRFFLSVGDAIKRVRTGARGPGTNGSTSKSRNGAGPSPADGRLPGESKEDARRRRAEDRQRQMEEVFGRG